MAHIFHSSLSSVVLRGLVFYFIMNFYQRRHFSKLFEIVSYKFGLSHKASWDWDETKLRLSWDWAEIELRLSWDWAETELWMCWEWAENEPGQAKTVLRLRPSGDRAETELRLIIITIQNVVKKFWKFRNRGRDLFSTTFLPPTIMEQATGFHSFWLGFSLIIILKLYRVCNLLQFSPAVWLLQLACFSGAANVNVFVNLLATFVTQKGKPTVIWQQQKPCDELQAMCPATSSITRFPL